MQATSQWLQSSGADYLAEPGPSGRAHLTHYSCDFQEWGTGEPLVLVPGLAGGYELLGPLARLLSKRYRVITYQLRGEEDCFTLRRRFGMSDLVHDLAEFLDWHSLERPAVLGVSFGGILALEFAARFPNRLRSLILQGVGARFEQGLLQQVASLVLSRYPLPQDSPFINQFFNLFFGRPQKPGPLFDFVTRQCWRTDQSVMAHRFDLVKGFDMTNRNLEIGVPTLALAGDRDLLVSRQNLQRLAGDLVHAEARRLEGCGHLAFVTRPDLVAKETARFLGEQRL